MFTTADLQHVDDLHHYGRQLAVLKRIYQSYSNIIERVLDGSRQVESTQSIASRNDAQTKQGVEPTETNETTMSTSIGVPISTKARVRFERLKDRIGLYCLNEIQDCIDEKDALVLLVGCHCVKHMCRALICDTELQSHCDQRVLGR